MTVDKLHDVLDPKVKGTINLHEALISERLDFFVMTSSSIGIKAPGTQSGYAAANAFQDSMARHRWNLGLQATSLSLGMVRGIGHIEEHPGRFTPPGIITLSHYGQEIEAAMLHNGLHGIDESEFLIMMELACRSRDLHNPTGQLPSYDPYSMSHIITGLEKNYLDRTPLLEALWLQDRRLQHFALGNGDRNIPPSTQNSETSILLAEAFATGGQTSVKNAVEDVIIQRLSSLLLIPVDKLKENTSIPLADLGMDSMVTGDIRTLAWTNFKADVPFLKILENGLLLKELIDIVWERMDRGLRHGDA